MMNKITVALLVSASFFVVATPVLAAAPNWTNVGTSSWFAAGNWSTAAVPGAGDTATITNAGTAQIDGAQSTAALTSLSVSGASTVEVQTGGTLSATNINLGNGATQGVLFLTGSATVTGAITLNRGVISNQFAGQTLSNAISLTGTSNGITSLNALSVGGVISGSGGITISGLGPVTFTGSNTYTGATTISQGTLALSGSGSIASSSTINDAAIFDISGATGGATIKGLSGAGAIALGAKTLTLDNASSSTFSGAIGDGGIAGGTGGGIALTGTSNLTLTGANTYTGTTTLGTGTILTVGNNTTTGSIVGNIVNNGTALGFRRSDAYTYAGVISGTGQLSQLGASVLTLTGANSYTGQTVINPGTLALSGTGSVSASSRVRVFGTFDISQTSAGATVQSLDAIPPGGGNPFTGAVFLGSRTLTIANAVSEFDGVIQDGGIQAGTGGKVVLLAGNEIFGGVNTYTGTTTISGGTLVLQGSGSIATSSAVADAGTLDISGTTSGASIKGLSGAGIVAGGSKVLTLTPTSGTFSGVIQDGGIAGGTGASLVVAANGSNTVSLSGANTYTGGTTINSGAILTIGSSGTTGSVVGNIIDNGQVIFARSNAMTYAGVISGSGIVGVFGTATGVVTLTGVNTVTGRVTTNPGTLALSGNGSLANASSIRNFGSFDISGTTAGTTIQSLELVPIGANPFIGSVFLGSKTLTIANASHEFDGVLQDGGIVAGTGGSVTLLAGTETFAGVNTYTGTTTISGGTLALLGTGSIATSSAVADTGTLDISGTTSGAAIKTLSGAGTVALGTQTLTLSGASTTFSGVIQNAGITTGTGGGLTLAAGAFTLSGTSTYTGATKVSGGTLNVTGSIASSAVTVASGASLTGTGTVGGTTISAGGILSPGGSAGAVGTLAVNGNLSLASTAVTNVDVSPSAADKITATGTAAIAGTLNATFATGTYASTQYTLVTSTGALSGTFANYNVTGQPGNFTSALSYNANSVFLNLSAVTFSSGSTTNVNSGTVTVSGNQTTGGLASSGSGGTVALSSGSTLTDNQNSNTTYSGTITGAGSFAKAGTGTLVLDGVNTYTGSTTISGGVLEIGDAANPGAAINGPVTIASGGTLSGHGTVNGSVTVGAGGNFQPGGTIGTINVGSTTFASGSTYTVETNAAGQGNNTIATGAITINSGATLAVTPDAPLTSYGRLTNYTILQAAGGISGTFSSVTSTAATLTPVVAYAPNTVTLTLVRPDLLATVATTTNQTSIGSVIAASSGSAVLTVLAPQSDAAVRTGFNQLSGDIHASLRSAAVEDSRIIRDTVLDHLGKTSDSMTVWGAGFGGYGSISTDGNANGLHHDMAGFIAGADMPLGQGFRLGLAGAYTSNNASVTGKASTASGNSGHVVAYGGWSDGKIDLKLGGDFGFGHVNVTRTLAAFTQTNTDRQNQRLAQVFGDAGYKFETSRAMVEPYVGIASISARTGAFAETGGSTALSGGSRTDTQTYSTVGMRASLAPMSLGESVGAITPHVDMGWQHAFKTFRPGQVETIAGLSQSFTVLGAPLASDAAAVRAGFDIALTPEAVLSLDYDGSFASRVQNNAVRGSLAWRF